MSEAPERIWAFIGGGNTKTQLWLDTRPPHPGMASETEYVRVDRIEALEREVKERKTSYDQLLTSWAESRKRHLAAEAREARLSEVLRALLDCPDIADNDHKDEETHAAERVARAALPGSGFGWPVPDGWKLVPVEPDDAMIEAGQDTCEEKNCWGGRVYASDIWESMLAASPAAPQQGGELC